MTHDKIIAHIEEMEANPTSPDTIGYFKTINLREGNTSEIWYLKPWGGETYEIRTVENYIDPSFKPNESNLKSFDYLN